MTAFFAYTFTLFVSVTVLFQLALALGAPWGELAMGGRFSGRLPAPARIAALVQAGLLLFLVVIVLVRSRLVRPDLFPLSETAIWFVVGIAALSLLMNLATPSRWERRIWAPVAAAMLLSSLVVAFA